MKAWGLPRPFELELLDLPVPAVRADEALVRIGHTGLCGSDLEIYRGRRSPEFLANPVRLGHEACGVVEEVGPQLRGLRPGDKVALRGVWGCLSEYVTAPLLTPPSPRSMPTLQMVKLPPAFPGELGPFIEVLPKVIRTGESIGVTNQTDVLIIGQGVCGLLLTQVLRMQNPNRLVTVDLWDEKLLLSRRFGATATFNRHQGPLAELVRSALPDGADVVIVAHLEGTGVPEAIDLLKWNGKLVLWGCLGRAEVDFYRLHARGGDIIGTRMTDLRQDAHYCQRAVDMVERGLIDVSSLVTHRFTLETVPAAFATKDKGTGDVVGVTVANEG